MNITQDLSVIELIIRAGLAVKREIDGPEAHRALPASVASVSPCVGAVGVDILAVAIGEGRDTIEGLPEPYLIQKCYLQRTSRGRAATAGIRGHFGLVGRAQSGTPQLFEGPA